MDARKNFAKSGVATAPSPANSGTSLTVTTGHGARFPTPPFQAVVWPSGVEPDATNAEIIRVTGLTSNTFTIVRAQEGTAAISITVGMQIQAGPTAKFVDDLTGEFAAKAVVQRFETPGVHGWSVSGTPRFIHVKAVGGGGGGGSGRRGATGSFRGGGGGGASGVVYERTFLWDYFDPEGLPTVTVGAGGAGGIGVTGDNTNGANGFAGGASSLGVWLVAPGGPAGGGGTSLSVAGGGLAAIAGFASNGANSGGTVDPNAVAGQNGSHAASGGGGGGGSITSGDVSGTGGAGGPGPATTSGHSGGAGGSTGGGAGTGSSTGGIYAQPSGGGGGGGANTGGPGGVGGAGADLVGAGGGGGGASTNGFNSGTGGAGGNGYVRITVIY